MRYEKDRILKLIEDAKQKHENEVIIPTRNNNTVLAVIDLEFTDGYKIEWAEEKGKGHYKIIL